MHPRSELVRTINGITFIDITALEQSIPKDMRVDAILQQKMINAGVKFWDLGLTIVKKPVIGISSIGGLLISFDNTPEGMIKLRMGKILLGPFTPEDCADGLRESMGSQSFHTFMNPKHKTSRELYDTTVSKQHFSIAHAAYLGFCAFGISKKAELELDVQRDLLHLARETSARSACQDTPTLVALTEAGASMSKLIRQSTLELLSQHQKSGKLLDWREERNALLPLSSAVSLGINADLRNLGKVISDLSSDGKELEYRNILALINDSLHGLLPELFKSTQSHGHQYPASWETQPAKPTPAASAVRMFHATASTPCFQHKRAILLLGAPGVGKSTQTERISKMLKGVMCISTGNLVRKLDQKVLAKQPLTAVEQRAAQSLNLMRQGQLMDAGAVYALLTSHLSPGGEGYAEYSRSHTIILDGVIKAEDNIAPFNAAVKSFNETAGNMPLNLSQVINITASEKELIERQELRVEEAEALGKEQRPDDSTDVYRSRLSAYSGNIQGVLNHYRQTTPFVDVDSSHGIDQTTGNIITAIQQATVLPEIEACAEGVTARYCK